MEDISTLKREEYSVELYRSFENLRLAEEQRREENERLRFKGCNLSYEHIWG